MKFPILGLVRVAALLALSLTTTAVGLGRWNSPSTTSIARESVRYVGLGGRGPGPCVGVVSLLDLETGTVEKVPLPKQEVLDQASASPWRDERGRVQVIGRWARFGRGFIAQNFGLARVSLPDGTFLDRVNTEILPVSPPCWYPGTTPRVLFAAGDGDLYHYRFASDDGQGADSAPCRITRRFHSPRLDSAIMVDPEWSTESILDGRLLVGMSLLEAESPYHLSPSKLHWLELNPSGTSIESLGAFLRHEGADETQRLGEERFPAVGRVPGEPSPQLAYLFRPIGSPDYQLRIVPIHQDPATHLPFANTSESRPLAEHCGPIPPRFTRDGHTLMYLPSRPNQTITDPTYETPRFARIAPGR